MQVVDSVKKFNKILNMHQKIRIVELMILMLIGGVLETISVTVIFPFIDMVMNPEDTMQRWYVRSMCQVLHIESERFFLVLVSVFIALLFVLKNIYLLAQYALQYRFVNYNCFLLKQRVLDNMMGRPYEFFLNASSGELMRIINGDIGGAFNSLTVILGLFTELIVVVMVTISIFVITPVTMLFIAVILLFLLIIITKVITPVMKKLGKESQKAGKGMNKWLLQSIQGIKEIKISSSEGFFKKKYNQYGLIDISVNTKRNFLGGTPRHLIEAISMSVMFIALAVLIYFGEDFSKIVPILSAVALASIRILPSVNRIATDLTSISFNAPLLDKMMQFIQDYAQEPIEKESDRYGSMQDEIPEIERDIRMEHVEYRYPGSASFVLQDASIEINKGESVGIVGASGAGKSTTADVILGLIEPQKGIVEIDGKDMHLNKKGWYRQIGYIPQTIFLLDGSIRENIAFGVSSKKISDERIWTVLEEAALAEYVRTLEDGLSSQIGERGIRLSGGQRQRIGIARALYHNPEVLIFDEATSSLDNNTEKEIMKAINGFHGKKTMIIIAHRLTTIKDCDHIYRVEHGRIIKER